MPDFLKIIPADSLPTFLASLAIIVGAAVVWTGRKIGSLLESQKLIKMDETKIALLDKVGDWAVNATNQYFKKYHNPEEPHLNAQKLEYAKKQARLNLPAEVSEKITDAQLESVIEAKVAKTNAVQPPVVVGSSLPPPTRVPSLIPTGKLPPPSKLPETE